MKVNKYNFINTFLIAFSFVSINISYYAINLFFIFIPFIRKDFLSLRIPNSNVFRSSLLYFFTIGILGFIYYSLNLNYETGIIPIRQLISFVLFNSIFLLSLFKDLKIYKSTLFKALFIASLINLFITLYKAVFLGFDLMILDQFNSADYKASLSSHNNGFIFCFAFITSLFEFKNIKNIIFKIIIPFVSFLGVILTFSRTSILSLSVGILSYIFLLIIDIIRDKKIKLIFFNGKFNLKKRNTLSFFIPLIFLTYPIIKFFGLLINNIEKLFAILNSFGVSELTRVDRWNFAFNFALKHPINGSSYLGVWAFDDIIGSLHSSFFDILFRTGFVGLILYIMILIDLVFFFLKKKEYILLSGLATLITYGISYEAMLWPGGLCLMSIFIYFRYNYNYINENS